MKLIELFEGEQGDYFIPQNLSQAKEDFMDQGEDFAEGSYDHIGKLKFIDNWKSKVTPEMIKQYFIAIKDYTNTHADSHTHEEDVVDMRYEQGFKIFIKNKLAEKIK